MSEQKTEDSPKPERTLGHYRVLDQIGQGGMAVVYKGVQASLNRQVAIKVLPEHFAQAPEMVSRFDREASVAAQLKHPSIVQVIDRGKEGSTLYIVMEYVEGESLDKVIERGPLSLEDTIDYCVQICEALQYAHEKGVVHRDLKPANILLDKESGRAKIADFGIATLQTDTVESLTLTMDTRSLGTLHYMSPEQQLDAHNVTHQTDIFAFGVMLYEMLTGRVPIGHFKLPSLVRSDIPIALDGIVSRCMAESPADRYQDAGEIKEELLRLTGRPRRTRLGRSRPARSRRRMNSFLVLLVLVVILAGGGGALYVLKPWQKYLGGHAQAAAPAGPPAPSTPQGAAPLLKTANAAVKAGDAEAARRSANQVLTQFPGSPEAAEARKLIDQLDAQRIDKDFAATVDKAKARVAPADASEEDYMAALALLDEASRRMPNHADELAANAQSIRTTWNNAFDAAMASGKQALQQSKWDEATGAFMRAQHLRADPAAEKGLTDVKRASELAGFSSAPDAAARMRHLALYLAMGSSDADARLVPKAQDLRALVEQVQTRRQGGHRLRQLHGRRRPRHAEHRGDRLRPGAAEAEEAGPHPPGRVRPVRLHDRFPPGPRRLPRRHQGRPRPALPRHAVLRARRPADGPLQGEGRLPGLHHHRFRLRHRLPRRATGRPRQGAGQRRGRRPRRPARRAGRRRGRLRQAGPGGRGRGHGAVPEVPGPGTPLHGSDRRRAVGRRPAGRPERRRPLAQGRGRAAGAQGCR